MADETGMIYYVNKYWDITMALPKEECCDLDGMKVIHPDDKDCISKKWKMSIKNTAPFMVEKIRMMYKDGTYHKFIYNANPMFDYNKNLCGWCGIIIDMNYITTSPNIIINHKHDILNAYDGHKHDILNAYDGQCYSPYEMYKITLEKAILISDSKCGYVSTFVCDNECIIKQRIYMIHGESCITMDEYMKKYELNNEYLNNFLLDHLISYYDKLSNTKKPYFTNKIPINYPFITDNEIKSYLIYPIVCGNKIIGIIGLANRIDGYNKHIIEILKPFVDVCVNISIETRNTKFVYEQKEKFEIILKNISSTVVVADDLLIIQYINKATETLFGYTSSELKGQSVEIFMLPDVKKHHCGYIEYYKKTGIRKIIGCNPRKVKGITKDGRVLDILLSLDEFYEDGKRFFTASFQNLEHIIKQQEKKLIIAKEVAKTKALFVANMSHEIRTPMNGVFGMLSLLDNTKLNNIQRGYITTCLSSAENLMVILNDILLFSKADNGSIILENLPFDLSILIEELIFIMASTIKEKIDLVYLIKQDVPIFLIGDQTRLKQILTNLINNAIKFTQFGDIAVEVSLVKIIDDNYCLLQFDVSDTGIGISKVQQENLFKPFSQADSSTTRKYGGTGLGLVISKLLIDLFKGKVWVNSRLGRGSTFTFTSILKINHDIDPKKNILCNLSKLQLQKIKKLRILVIDDNPINCMLLDALLTNIGITVETCRSGMDGINCLKLSKIKNQKFDILLLDHHMPVMDGIDVARYLFKINFEIKIICLSSSFDNKKILSEPNIIACSLKPIKKASIIYIIYSTMENIQQPCNINNKLDETIYDENINNNILNKYKKCILIVEDNEINRRVIVEILESIGFVTDEAVNGIDALEKLDCTNYYCAILMDIHMPFMDGIETTKIIRKSNKEIPIIALTSDATLETKDKCFDVGMNSYLSKPVNFQKLTTIINKLIINHNLKYKGLNISILIVDDDKTNHIVLEELLKQIYCKFNICHAYDGNNAIQLFDDKYFFDIVFMDISMPIMDGSTATKIIKKKYNSNQIVIGVTGYDYESDHVVFMDAGMIDILIKPICLVKLKEIIIKYTNIESVNLSVDKKEPLNIEDTNISVNDIDNVDKKNAFNFDMLNNIGKNNKAVVNLLLSKWDEQIHNAIDDVYLLLDSTKNYNEIKNIMHSIKGSSYQIGANLVGNKAKNIEKIICDDNTENIKDNIVDFVSSVKESFEFLETHGFYIPS
jgi:PAS domain S-box-containing protein